MHTILFAAPLFLVFEMVQLFFLERRIGVKALKNPLEIGAQKFPKALVVVWLLTLVVYWLWMGLAVAEPQTRAQGATLFVVSLFGFFIRRQLSLKWMLVALTFEGALRVGMLISITGAVVRGL